MSQYNGFLGTSAIHQGYQFAVWAPNAKAVSVIGNFNDWEANSNVMQKTDNGIWWCDICGAENGNEYQFSITTQSDETLTKNDPRARHLTNSAGHSIIYKNDFAWDIQTFEIPALQERVIYELHIGTFAQCENKTEFDAAIDKLPSLVDLGINVIEIMPINEFAGDISWGYNPAYPFAVEESYGGPDALKRFIDASHKHGIAVIIDVVYNHFGPSDLDIWQFDGWNENDKGGIYFYNDDRSITPWGDTRPDYGRKEVKDYIKDNAMMWLNEFNADGLRMDMIPYIRTISGADDGSDDIAEGVELIKTVNDEIKSQFPAKMSIAEDLHGHDFITQAVDEGGLGYSAQWDANFVHPIRSVMTASDDNSIDLEKVKNALLHRYNNNPFTRVVYTESHDEVANGKARIVEEVAPGNVDDDYFAKQKGVLCAVLVLTSAGVPMLFQGQELKSPGWFTDTKMLEWDRRETYSEYYDVFKTLVSLRRNTEGKSAGLTGTDTTIVHEDNQNKVIAYLRHNTEVDGKVLVILNLSSKRLENYQINFEMDNAECVFEWDDGLKQSENEKPSLNNLCLAGYGALIFV